MRARHTTHCFMANHQLGTMSLVGEQLMNEKTLTYCRQAQDCVKTSTHLYKSQLQQQQQQYLIETRFAVNDLQRLKLQIVFTSPVTSDIVN